MEQVEYKLKGNATLFIIHVNMHAYVCKSHCEIMIIAAYV